MAAATGHLVIIQMSESSAEGALATVKMHTKYNVDPLILGVSSQVLIPQEKGGQKAKYTFL